MTTLQKLDESRKIEKDLQGAFKENGEKVLTPLYEKIIDLIYESNGELSTAIDFDDRDAEYVESAHSAIYMAILQKVISRLDQELTLVKKESPIYWFQITSTLKDVL